MEGQGKGHFAETGRMLSLFPVGVQPNRLRTLTAERWRRYCFMGKYAFMER